MMSSGKAFRLSVTLDGTDPVKGGKRGVGGGAALTNQQSIRLMSRACSGQSVLTLSVVFPFQRSQKDTHYAHTGCTGCCKSGFETQRFIIRHTRGNISQENSDWTTQYYLAFTYSNRPVETLQKHLLEVI